LFNYLKLNQDQFSCVADNLKIIQKKNINKSKLIYKTKNTVTLHITKFSVIENIIIPFFEKYPISGIKNLDFVDFKKVSEIIKNKFHLTLEGFKKIKDINSQMNQRRSIL